MASLLPKEFQERPLFVRITATLSPELAAYVVSQSKRFPSLRGEGNQSAFVRELVEAHRAKFFVVRAKKGRK